LSKMKENTHTHTKYKKDRNKEEKEEEQSIHYKNFSLFFKLQCWLSKEVHFQ